MFVDKVNWVMIRFYRDGLQAHLNDPDRLFKVLPILAVFPEIDIKDPAVDLLFLSEYEEISPLVGGLYDYRDRYQAVLDTIKLRNELHLNQLQGAFTELAKQGKIQGTPDDIKREVGLAIWNRLKITTDALYMDTDHLLKHHAELKTVLVRNFKRLYPKAKMLEVVP